MRSLIAKHIDMVYGGETIPENCPVPPEALLVVNNYSSGPASASTTMPNPRDACAPLGITGKLAPNPSTKQTDAICTGSVQTVDKAIDTTNSKIDCVESGGAWDTSSNSCKE
ncbi:MAG: hypothetical protein KGI40_11805 [Xanthomonadaceae bacterium]|nr:hypothetical protein [Xanthomonadaceae bacterium]MDE2178014.1 hypothetical protein [Xanthomonadaceae bacterium]MDE2246648.1 hypothetical protein [Xanthomonadaceae bacterium]